ncbi:hypothetical protein V5799_030409 [Amblyomma americanum]|uniref:MADF domain-containing protein n=2 Tax=Amblyomma americanum TaxID=6943 RepID=A0AAQ4EN68_AMBAM
MSRGLFNEVLIIEVSKRPLLWDVKDNFRNKSTKESLWEEVRDAIRAIDDTVTVEEIIARWKNLKDTYGRKIKDEKDGEKSGSGATAKTSWPLLKQMEFLRDSMETRRRGDSGEPDDDVTATAGASENGDFALHVVEDIVEGHIAVDAIDYASTGVRAGHSSANTDIPYFRNRE